MARALHSVHVPLAPSAQLGSQEHAAVISLHAPCSPQTHVSSSHWPRTYPGQATQTPSRRAWKGGQGQAPSWCGCGCQNRNHPKRNNPTPHTSENEVRVTAPALAALQPWNAPSSAASAATLESDTAAPGSTSTLASTCATGTGGGV